MASTMRLFGDWHRAPITEDAEQVPTPIGTRCMFGDGLIAKGDAGLALPHVDAGGEAVAAYWHRHCFMLSIVGPAAIVETFGPSGFQGCDAGRAQIAEWESGR